MWCQAGDDQPGEGSRRSGSSSKHSAHAHVLDKEVDVQREHGEAGAVGGSGQKCVWLGEKCGKSLPACMQGAVHGKPAAAAAPTALQPSH